VRDVATQETSDLPGQEEHEFYASEDDYPIFNSDSENSDNEDEQQQTVKILGLKYGQIVDDDPVDYHDVDIGQQDETELRQAVDDMMQRAVSAGISNEGFGVLQEMVSKYYGIFRTRLGADPPAKVRPLKIQMRPDTAPVRSAPRTYSRPSRS
jgi:hypothetical protein